MIIVIAIVLLILLVVFIFLTMQFATHITKPLRELTEAAKNPVHKDVTKKHIKND